MLFKHDEQLSVDLGDLQSEKENLANFLLNHFKVDASPSHEGLKLGAQDVSLPELERMVNKFIYHQNLNGTHWVAIDKNVVKINRFKHVQKIKKDRNPLQPSIIKHGW